MGFTWSGAKCATHIKSHGLDFIDAQSVFEGVTYTFEDAQNHTIALSLHLEETRLPEINGAPLDLAPTRANDSPWLKSGDTPGEAMIAFEDDRMTLRPRP